MIDTSSKNDQELSKEEEFLYDDNDLDDEDYSDEANDRLNQLLKSLTHDFTLTYSEIKNDITLKKEPLSKFTSDHIKRVIKNAR